MLVLLGNWPSGLPNRWFRIFLRSASSNPVFFRVGMRRPFFVPDVWIQYDSVVQRSSGAGKVIELLFTTTRRMEKGHQHLLSERSDRRSVSLPLWWWRNLALEKALTTLRQKMLWLGRGFCLLTCRRRL